MSFSCVLGTVMARLMTMLGFHCIYTFYICIYICICICIYEKILFQIQSLAGKGKKKEP